MENVFLCGVLFTFCLIKYNSAQALPTQSDRDLSTFVADFFSFNKTVLESYTPPPTKDEKIIQLVNSIFNNKSLSEPQAVIPCDNGELGPGECTHFYLCSDNRSITIDGTRIIDFRLGEVCPLLKPCCTLKTTNPMTDYIPKFPTACGTRNRNGLKFITKNPPTHQAQEGEFAWTVALLERKAAQQSDEDSPFLCGGSLIHPQVVMTAAHCLINKRVSNLFVRAGDWDSLSNDEFLPHQDRDVQEIILHDHFAPNTGYNDIALLVLKTPVVIAENVNTICLPPIDYDFTFQRCIASGWGTLSWKERHFLSIMKRIELPIIEFNACQERLRKTRLGIHFQLHDSFICAGGEKDVDTCRGDGGSPLVCEIPGTVDQYYQAGIVSWGIGCGDDVPAAYVNISHFRKWIDEHVMRKKFDISSYDAEASKKIDYRHPEPL